MFIVLTAAFLIISISLFIWNAFDNYDKYEQPYSNANHIDFAVWWIRGAFAVICTGAAIGVFITLLVYIPKVSTTQIYEERIKIVQESNEETEQKIVAAVNVYLIHEKDTIGEIYDKVDNATTAIAIYLAIPELKGDELTKQLIDTYQANNEEIKNLRLEQAELAKIKFLVYFGH